MSELMLFEKKNKVYISSKFVAEKFSKRHDSILITIRTLIDDNNKSKENGSPFRMDTPEFNKQRYIHEQNHQEYIYYELNKRAFLLLMMRLKGEIAFELQNEYIDKFEQMEEIIRQRQTAEWQITRKQGKLIRRTETDALQLLIPYAEEQGSTNIRKQAYATYTKLVNSTIGIDAGQRDTIPFSTLITIATLEDIVTNTILEQIKLNVYYKDIYKKCKENCKIFIDMIRPKLQG